MATMNLKAEETGPPAAEPPVHERVYQELRARVLYGELRPGQAVTIQGLARDLNAGATPVREAIRRMMADGGLVFQGNRRVSVPMLGRQDAEQLEFIRLHVEPELTRRACGRITPAQLAGLRTTDRAIDAAIAAGDIGQYLKCNHRFHETIYNAAKAPILAQTVARLWLRFGPSLRVVCGRFGTQNLPDRHRDILAALASGDADAAARAMAGDISQGMQQILEVLDETSPDSRLD